MRQVASVLGLSETNIIKMLQMHKGAIPLLSCRMQETAIARVSDDFYPRNSSSSYPHIAACAFNGFFMSAILHVSPSAVPLILSLLV